MRLPAEIEVSGALSLTHQSRLTTRNRRFDAARAQWKKRARLHRRSYVGFARRAGGMSHSGISLRLKGTSRLSASARRRAACRRDSAPAPITGERPQALDGGPGSVWLKVKLIWREFYRHLLTTVSGIMQTPAVYPLDKTRRVAGETRTIFRHGRKAKPVIPIVVRRCASEKLQRGGLDA